LRPKTTSRPQFVRATILFATLRRASICFATAGLSCVFVALATGCSDAQIDAAVKKILSGQRTPQQYLLVALSDEDPDERRNAVAHVAQSDQKSAEWALKGYVMIALYDEDSQARCVALRALAQARDPRAVDTALKILNSKDYPARLVRPPDDLTRWDATGALVDLLAADAVAESSRNSVKTALLALLASDSSRDVRVSAARGLGFCAEDEVVPALIAGLGDDDFAVVHECEMALVRLTGRTHDCRPRDWQAWYETNHESPFARRGEVPLSRRPPYTGRWSKLTHDTRELFRWLMPPRKE